MKTYRKLTAGFAAITLALGFTACSDDDNYDNPSGETFIYEIAVSNGGFTGADKIAGDIDDATKTISFTIPAETDIQAVQFTTKLSLGAHLDQPTYDVSSGSADITVVNNANSQVYKAIFTLLPATEAPIINSITCINDQGVECVGFVSNANSMLYLNCENSEYATIVNVGMNPKRSKYTFTNLVDGKILAEDPGKVEVEFEGHTTTYDISFLGVPTFGADFTEAKVYDYSKAATIWPDFEAENTRWAKFDGENLFYLSRQGGTLPSVITWESVKNGSPVAQILDVTGIGVGTFPISAGGIASGHFYACNLSTGLSEDMPLMIYHWADKNAVCETLLSFPGNDEVKGRWGDNMSVTLDAAGNGYLWFFDHASGANAVRFAVTNFTEVSAEPQVLPMPYSCAYYASLNPVIGEEGVYTLSSGYQRAVLLVDIDLNLLNRVEEKEGCDYPMKGDEDPLVINYAGERYMLMTNYFGWGSEKSQTLKVFDLSTGMNSVMAFTEFANSDRTPLFMYDMNNPTKCSAYSANTGAGIGPDGELRLMAASPRAGFILVEVPKKR